MHPRHTDHSVCSLSKQCPQECAINSHSDHLWCRILHCAWFGSQLCGSRYVISSLFLQFFFLSAENCCELTFRLCYDLFSSVFAILAVVATALSQIFTSTYQKSLDCNALQLLYHTSPVIGAVSTNYVYYCPILMCVLFSVEQLGSLSGLWWVHTDILCNVFCFYSIGDVCLIFLQGMLIMCPLFDDVTALQNHVLTSGCVGRICKYLQSHRVL